MAGSFFDTNVVIYLSSADPAKADRAESLIGAGGTINVQVLNEVTNVARRKMGLSWAQTNAFLCSIRAILTIEPITLDIHLTGMMLAKRYGLSIYDAMIAAAALRADCDILFSEDIQHGMVIDGQLHIVNPFRAAA
jgi:predicted nucleic acid-binding protein